MQNIKITDVRAVPGDSAFLIDDGKTAILYDSGFAFTGFAVADKIRAALGTRPLDYIFLTHSHYDHALGAAYALEYYPDAKVVAGEYAVKIFAKPTAKTIMRDLDRKFAAASGVTNYVDLIDNLRVDIPVADGDVICAGDMEFVAVNLPGHTRCSIGYYLPAEKLLLGCETLGVFDGEETVCPSYLVGVQMALDSITRAETLDIANILVPHYGLLDRRETKMYFAKSKQTAVEVAERIANILKNGGTPADAEAYFLDTFYHGYLKVIYPPDAIALNTRIMVKLVAKEYGIPLVEV